MTINGPGSSTIARLTDRQDPVHDAFLLLRGNQAGRTPPVTEGRPMTTLERLYTEYGRSPWLEALVERASDRSRQHSATSLLVSRLDTQVDRLPETAGTRESLAPPGRASIAPLAGKAHQLSRS